MNKSPFFFVSPLTLTLVFVCCFTSVKAWSEAIAVTVQDALTKRPLAEVAVKAESRRNRLSEAQTGINGRAVLDKLSGGLYEVTLSLPGYDTIRLPSVRVIAGKSTPVVVTMFEARKAVEEVTVLGVAQVGNNLDPASTSQLDRESLRSAAGSGSDVLRALDGLPGLFSDGGFSSFTVRGNGPRTNLILVDDIPFDRVVHFNNSFGDLDEVENGGRYSVFAPNIVGKAEFQPGGWNAAYGGRAGSLLKLDVAEGNPDTPAYTLRLDIAGVEVGYDGPSGFHKDTSVLFSARQLDFGRVFEFIGQEDFGEPVLSDVIIKTASQLGNDNKVSFLLIVAPEKYTRDISHVLASDEDEPGVWENIELVETDADNSLAAVTWSSLLGESGELVNRLYWREYSEAARSGEAFPDQVPVGTSAADIPQRFPIVSSQNDESEWGWRLDYSVDNPLGRIDLGLRLVALDLLLSRELSGDWIRYEYDQSDFRPNPEQKYIVYTPESANTRFEQSATQWVIYADQQFSLGAVDMRLGLRYENDGLVDDDQISPRFAASWLATDDLSVSLTAGRYLQAPLFENIAADVNNTLQLEQTDQLSLGFKYRTSEDIELFIEPYYQRLQNLVVRQDGVNQIYANTGEGTGYGFDTAITRFFDNGWSANFTYSYNQVRLQDQPGSEKYDADYSRPHSASMGGIWEISERWKISGRIKYASGRPFDDFIINEDVLGEGQLLRFSKEYISDNTERYDGFFSINTRIDYRKSFGRTNLIAFLDIINLTGSDNPSNQDFNERTGTNKTDEGNLFPLIGFRLEW